MAAQKKRMPKSVIIILCITIPVLLAAFAFFWVGSFYRDDDKIYPNISIAEIDVSGLTREEAFQALSPAGFTQQADNAGVVILFPDETEFTINGKDVRLKYNTQVAVDNAFDIGRGGGYIGNTISFLLQLDDEQRNLNISYELDTDILFSHVTAFVEGYNSRLDAAKPVIFNDRIEITKGTGRVYADALEINDMAYVGLLESLYSGETVRLVYKLPESVVNAAELCAVYDSVHTPAVSAEIDRETWLVSDSVAGVSFDIYDAVSIIKETESGKTATIYLDHLEPEITKEHLESLLFRDLIGECTTWVHGNAGRLTNIELSSAAINGQVLEPGDVFSFNGIVGQRTQSKGYRLGGAYFGSETRLVTGGGICQVSSTVYSAVKDTGLKIVERYQHSRPVPYLPRGRDATVFWGALDFKFENNTEYPIRVDITFEDRDLTVQVYGTIVDGFPVASTCHTGDRDG